MSDNWISVVGGVSSRTGKPFIEFRWGEKAGQLGVEEARAHALLILEACTNAVADAALLDWAREEGKFELPFALAMIDALRRYRSDRWGQPNLDMEFSDPATDD